MKTNEVKKVKVNHIYTDFIFLPKRCIGYVGITVSR